VSLWRGGNDPPLFAERRMYLKAIQDALAGTDEARVVLARVVKRLGDRLTPGRLLAGEGMTSRPPG
jgi:hypothetical protein